MRLPAYMSFESLDPPATLSIDPSTTVLGFLFSITRLGPGYRMAVWERDCIVHDDSDTTCGDGAIDRN